MQTAGLRQFERCADALTAAGRLDRWFERCPSAVVALSGGVDSTLVAFWARRVLGREGIVAYTADSPSLKRADLEIARALCIDLDIPQKIVRTDEIDDPRYAANPVNRCFHCKTTLYHTLARTLARGSDAAWILSGANLDDLGDYRPGLEAAANARVRHPLLECGIGKDIIRELARSHGISVWDKPASPCLSSRIPYGQPVSREKLARVEAAERWLFAAGFEICRVRHDGATARIEVPPERIDALRAILPRAREALRAEGFEAVELDREGFVSGKLNRGIARRAKTAD